MESPTTTSTSPWRKDLTRSVRPLESSSVMEAGGVDDYYNTGDYTYAGPTDPRGLRAASPPGPAALSPGTSSVSSSSSSRWPAYSPEDVPAATRGGHRHRHHREEFTQELPYLLEDGRTGGDHGGGRAGTDMGYTGSIGGGYGRGGDWERAEVGTRSAEHDTLHPLDEVVFRGITSMEHDVASDKTLTETFNRTLLAMDPLTVANNPHQHVPYYIFNSTFGGGLNTTGETPGPGGGSPVNLGPEERVSLIVLYTLTTLLAVLGNVLVILVFTFGKRSRTDLRIFLINLAFADLVMAIFCMPFTFTMTMLGNWVFSAPMCPIVLYMQTVSVTASVCTNMAIGIDRFWVVSFPLKSRLTKSRSRLVIGVVWCIALSLSVVQLVVGRSRSLDPDGTSGITLCEEAWPSETWRRTYTFFILILTYLLPLSILSLAYGIVAWKLWQRTTPGNADQARDHQQLRSKRKIIKMLSVVVMLFGICWLPLHVFFLVLDFAPALTDFMTPAKEKLLNGLYYTAHWLAMSNSFVNPIIYGFLNDSFRSDLKRLFRRWFPCCRFLPCLATSLTRESTIVVLEYSRYGGRRASSSSTGTIRISDSSKKLLGLKVNGVSGSRYDSEMTCRNHLLSSKARKPKERDL